jgi:hypothetical protein
VDGYYEDADGSYPTTRMNGELKNSCKYPVAVHQKPILGKHMPTTLTLTMVTTTEAPKLLI